MSTRSVSWDEVSETIKQANPNAYAILNTEESLKQEPFTLYQYPYGATVADSNHFYSPEGEVLGNNIPFGIILDKQFDLFVLRIQQR